MTKKYYRTQCKSCGKDSIQKLDAEHEACCQHPACINTYSVIAQLDEKLHPLADIEPRAIIGKNTRIWRFVHIMNGAVIGKDCVIGQGCFVQEGAVIGDRVKIQNSVAVYKGVTLASDVFCGPSCVFTNVRNPRSEVNRKDALHNTWVGKGVTIGANATIVCGTVLGEYAFIGAGAVVTRDVKAHALMLGNPAECKGYMCKCGERVMAINAPPFKTTAPRCNHCREKDKE
jgi:UDP-2-acetamido-3-amino-2,3-dideoxy-glucuronate N-acetyltransferase